MQTQLQIQIIAFSSLLFSQEMVLNQFGFLVCFCVLMDTFVVRIVLVPAIMMIYPKYNWWPAKVPEATKDEHCFDYHAEQNME